jgi:hypothetical protein
MTSSIHGPLAGTSSRLQLENDMTFESWLVIGRRLSRITNASPWWLGDWLIYGRRAYGERYKAALSVTDLDYQTLRNYAWVARSFPVSRRRDSLSFQHHAEVAALPEPEQDLWLQRADASQWSKTELRRRISAERRAVRNEPSPVTVRFEVEPDRAVRWQAAAAEAGLELAEWITGAADAAATTPLVAPQTG